MLHPTKEERLIYIESLGFQFRRSASGNQVAALGKCVSYMGGADIWLCALAGMLGLLQAGRSRFWMRSHLVQIQQSMEGQCPYQLQAPLCKASGTHLFLPQLAGLVCPALALQHVI